MIKSQKPYPFSLIEDIFGEDYETTGIYFPGLSDYKILMEMYENISKSTATKENPVDINKAKNILSVPIEELDLSVRSYNCLKRAEKTTVSDLLKLNYEDLLRIRNLGAKSAEEIRNRLKEHGIELKEGRSDE